MRRLFNRLHLNQLQIKDITLLKQTPNYITEPLSSSRGFVESGKKS